MFKVGIQAQQFDLRAEHEALSRSGTDVGAIVSFTGQVRDELLELEHYPAMAQHQLEQILSEARSRWPLKGATIIHRYGKLAVGEQIVLVLCASSHRRAAFESAEFLMDWLKTRAPFWKKAAAGWIQANIEDTEAENRWK